MANLPLAFAELLAGGLLMTAGATGDHLQDIIAGNITLNPFAGNSSGGSASATASPGAVLSGSGYTNPLQHVSNWERTDQGVDANLPVGAPIVAPGKIKILGVENDWYSGQPFVYWRLLDGPDAGKVQYVAEQITNLAPVGAILNAGDTIARYASSGTGIEFGWATPTGQTLAQATTGYTEGEATQAGQSIRQWLNSLGAGAGAN